MDDNNESTSGKVSKGGLFTQNIGTYHDEEGKFQTSLAIEYANLNKPSSLRSKISRRLHAFVPILDWFPDYAYKKYLVGDIVGGLTIGVMHTTQGIAYALLARVDPVYGLYTSFFPALFYAIFGTSRHASVGSFAIVALMCGMAVDRVMAKSQLQRGLNNTLESEWAENNVSIPSYTPIEIAATITVIQGVITLLTAICCLEFVTKYFSDTLVSGFTTGAAVHVAVGQLNVVLGINVKSVGNMQIFERIANIIAGIPEANPYVVITSLCSMLFIYIGKEFIDPPVRRRSKAIQIPYELILIVAGTVISYTMKLQDDFHVRCVGNIPVGMPRPQMPRFDLISECLADALAIAALSIAIHISMAKMLAKKLKYNIDAGQELYAFGIMGVLSGAFTCYPSSTSMGRTLVSVASGSQTQLASLISCIFVMGIILFFGPLFHTLPMCVLAAIILMALRRMFQKSDELKHLWRICKIDFLIWVIAFTSTVVIGVIYGLAISMAFSLLTVVIRAHLPADRSFKVDESYLSNKIADLGPNPKTACWHTASNFIIYRFSSPLSFANVDTFRESFQKTFNDHSRLSSAKATSVGQLGDVSLLLDFARTKFIDTSGTAVVQEVVKEMEKRQMNVFFVNANAKVARMLQLCGLEKHIRSTTDIPV